MKMKAQLACCFELSFVVELSEYNYVRTLKYYLNQKQSNRKWEPFFLLLLVVIYNWLFAQNQSRIDYETEYFLYID